MSPKRPNPYVVGKCAYGLKTYRRHEVVPCGLDAREYEVTRVMRNSEIPNPLRYKVWLCEQHRHAMMNDGFSVDLTTVTPVK